MRKEQALSAKRRRKVASKLASIAKANYGELKRRKVRPSLDQLVQSILWHNASVRRGTRAFRELKRAFVDWNEVRVSPVAEVAGAISSARWAMLCAESIRRVLWNLFETRNVVSLDFLKDMSTAQARACLQELPGVSRDLADEILLFSLGADLLPTSEGAARMCYRLGLTASDRATLQNQKVLMEFWAPELYPATTLFFIDYANSACRENKPRHKDYPLNAVCPQKGT